jgi:serine/threonine protein kinase
MQADDMTGQLIGHYRLLSIIDHGGTSTIFRALDIHLHREVAVKIFAPREGHTEEFLRRFAREARVLAQLDHPQILPVYEYGEQNGKAYLVMPLMNGGSLRDRLRKQRIIPPAETVHLIGQVLTALQYAHDRGLIHRDIKPGNMLFKARSNEKDGDRLYLSDFGLVKVLSSLQESMLIQDGISADTRTLTGTPSYMAPEQIMNHASQVSDIYAMGIVLYEMLTGEQPFTSDTYVGLLMKHLHESPRPLRAINPRISPALEAVVLRAMAKDPDQRYQRPQDLQEALEQVVSEAQAATWKKDFHATTPANTRPHSPDRPSQGGLRDDLTLPSQTSSTLVSRGSYANRQSDPPSYSPMSIQRPAIEQFAGPQHTQRRIPRPLVFGLIALATLFILGGSVYAGGLLPRISGPTPQPSATSPAAVSSTPSPKATTVPMPSTSIDCPDENTARAAVTAPLVRGNQNNAFYIENEGSLQQPGNSILKRYDINSKKTVEVSKLSQSYISEAQLSQNGQWMLFTAQIAGRAQLRMVRIDGQGMQTLFCAPINQRISGTQWSYNQHQAVFNVGIDRPTTYLMDLPTGNVQALLVPEQLAFMPITWLDSTHIYLTSFLPNSDSGLMDIYVLDTKKGTYQHLNDLQKIQTSPCHSFDTDYDSKLLFITSCKAEAGPGWLPTGPTILTVQPAKGGKTEQVTTFDQAVTTIRTISKDTFLLVMMNSKGASSIWKMKLDGSNLTRLTADSSNEQSLCSFSQYTWSNASPDLGYYAFQTFDTTTKKWRLFYGSLATGGAIPFASPESGETWLIGWSSL